MIKYCNNFKFKFNLNRLIDSLDKKLKENEKLLSFQFLNSNFNFDNQNKDILMLQSVLEQVITKNIILQVHSYVYLFF